MSRLQKDSTIPSVASTSQEDQESRTLKVTLLSSEWRSSTDGDLSTINRELAIQLAKHPNVDVSILLPNCSGEDRSSAENHNVKLIEADKTPGLEPVLCLSSPPINHTMDCVISHGVHLGRLIPLLKKNPSYSHCKWIQVVHSALEEDGMYKNISEGEKMQKTEIQLCKMADQVITIGPKLAEVYKRHLCGAKQEKKVFDLTPGIFSEFLEVEQATEERGTFCILVIGSGDSCEDFNVKGCDIAAQAIAELKDESYKLKFVCPAGGKGNIVAEKLLHHGISRSQLIVRSFDDSREVLADLFCEVDLAIIPSRTEGFGITALEALSAGLPVLVSGNSGLGEALKEVPFGSQSVVNSEHPKDWAKRIQYVRRRKREVRLLESSLLCEKYLERYSWEEPCKSLVIKMRNLVFGGSEQVIHNLQKWQQDAGRCKISSNTDRLSDLKKIALEKGYRISDNEGSGNCMFYALSEQLETVKRVTIHHFELRRSLVQYLREHPKNVHGTDLFHFVDGHATWGGYLTDMAQDGTWGDYVILWAAANCYQIAIHVISSLPGHSEVIINPDCPFDKSKHLVLGHVHEVHYVSLQPLQGSSEIRATLAGKDKRKASIRADQPHKRLREELTNHDYYEDNAKHSLNNHGQDHFPGATPTHRELVSQISGAQDHELAVWRRLLSAEYNRRSLLKPLFWLNTIKLALDDVYTRLSIVSRRKTDFVLEGNEVDMFNIFRTLNKGEDAMVLVEGSPGIGKTTFCLKISHDWANGTIPNESSFPLFELLLLLKCRDIHGDVMDAIVDQLLPEDIDQNATKNVVRYIKDIHNQERILIILDGLDELPKTAESSVDKLLHRRILPFCYVLATSRQEKGIEVRQNVDFDVLLQIKGFTEVDSYDYIRKHFRHLGHDYEPKGGWLIKAIQDNSYLHELPSNPLNLLLLCVVFEEYEGNLPSCRTDLYQIIVLCLLRRYCARHNDDVTAGAAGDAGAGSDKALMRHFEDSLLVLGELAWRCLEEGRFSFREEELVEFESKHKSLAARKLGLVFKEASLRKINPQHGYFFFHKTFQEYLAAFYLAYRLLKRKIDFFSELNLSLCNDMMVRYRQVFIFMSGILGEEAGLLFEQIGKKLKDVSWDWDWNRCKKEWASFFHDCFSESRNYEKVAMALCSFISFPQTITIDLSKMDRSTELFVILNACTSFSQLQLPVHLAIKSSKSMVLADVNNDLLADFVAFNTRLQTLSFSVLVMTEEISTLLCRVLRVDSTAYSFTLEVTCSNISSLEVGVISNILAANKTLKTVTFKLPCKILEDYVAILDKGLSADTPLTSIVLKTFGPWMETEAELLRKILLNRSGTSQSLAVGGKVHDSLATSVSEGLVANSSPKSLALIFCGKLSYSGLSLLKEGFLGNRSLESLQLKVFGELPTNWANICGTLQSAIKSTTSFTVYPNVTGMVGNSQVAFLCPFLKENISASKLHSVTVNIWGELDCSGATDLCKLLIASSASCVNLNMNGRITDSVADCLFRHFDKLDTLSYLSIDIQGEVMGDGKNSLQRLSSNQIYLFAFNVHSFNSGNNICKEFCLSTDDSSPITPVFAKVKDGCVTKLSVSINNPGSISEDWKCNLFEGLAKNECVTTLNLVFNNLYLTENLDALWDAVGENATLTTLSLTVNDYYELNRRWIWDMVGGLAKNTSLTTLSFTVDNYDRSITNWTWGLVGGLAKNTSLTTLSFTVNNYCETTKEWTWGLDDALVKNTSLTMLSLTVNNYSTLVGEWTCGLGEGVGKNTSLTTLNLTVNNYYYMSREWTHDLCHALAKNRSLTALSLTVNNYGTFVGDWTCDLGHGLANNMSLTMLSLTVNNYSRLVGRWACGLVKGLVKNVSLTTLSLTVNNYSEMSEKWTLSLYDGLAKNTSLVTLNLTFSNWNNLYEDWIHGLVDALVTNASLAAISLEVNIFAEGNKNSESILA